MSFFTRERIELAVRRTERQFQDTKKYAFQNQVQASAVVGVAFLAAMYFPGSVVLALCVSALALICFNLCKKPNTREVATEAAAEFASVFGF